MSKRIAAIVLTFHPTTEVVTNVVAILKQVDKIYLVNNEYDEAAEKFLNPLKKYTPIQWINLPDNKGVASGFNNGLKCAFEDGFDFFILFDQDSLPNLGMVHGLIHAYYNCKAPVGIIGPKLVDHQTGKFFDVKTGVYRKNLLISSGSLFARSQLQNIGYLRDDYFIDYVDHEYCLRTIKAGKINYCCADVSLQHQFGEPQIRQIFGFKFTVSNYSEFRHFYMARNRILLMRDYGFKYWFQSDLQHMVKMYLKVTLFEERKIRKLVAIVRGTFMGVLGLKSAKN